MGAGNLPNNQKNEGGEEKKTRRARFGGGLSKLFVLGKWGKPTRVKPRGYFRGKETKKKNKKPLAPGEEKTVDTKYLLTGSSKTKERTRKNFLGGNSFLGPRWIERKKWL